jgi:alpha-galactosidase
MVKIVLLGAGSVEFTHQLSTDLFRFDDLPQLQIVLYDINPERLNFARVTAEQAAARFDRKADIVTTLDRRAALDGADFVINVIAVGGLTATRKDLEIPAAMGLRQTVGDTTGVGGVFRALRTFPVLSQVAAEMVELCPDAWFLNYTNPMAMNVWWMSEIAPQIKSVGLCHSVYWTVNDLCELVGVPMEGTHFRAAGVNHLSWLTEWSRDGEDLYPRLRKAIEDNPELNRRVRVEVMKRIGYYSTESSLMTADYLPWFMRSDEQIEKFKLEPSKYIDISLANVAEFELAKAALDAGKPLPFEESSATEYAPLIIHSLLTGTEREIHANVVNHGYISNLPDNTVVEVPALLDGTGVHPIQFGDIPSAGAALDRTYLSVASLTIEAARTGNPELVRQAVLIDPNASSSLTPEQIWALCDQLTAAHADVLPAALGGRLGA